jgi:protoporphyrinogen oxidase
MSAPIVIVGAGMAGLVCARVLHAAGRAVLVLEREATVGGRVRTRQVAGCTVDRGFQVAFEAYPTVARHVDYARLDMRWFAPAGRVCAGDGTSALVGDALADPTLLWPTLTQGGLSWADLWQVWRLRRAATARSFDACFAADALGSSTRDWLRTAGVSEQGIARFFAPFYGGILLDRSLETSASVLLYTFKMLAEGRTGVPRQGMGAIPTQMASGLPAGSVRTLVTVRTVEVTDGRATGVTLSDGSRIAASAVVLATEAPALAELLETAGARLAVPRAVKGVTTVYWTSGRPVLSGRALWLNAAPQGVLSHGVTVTNVAPEHAPAGTHLLATNSVGDAAALDDATLVARTRGDLQGMTSSPLPADLQVLAIERVPMAQVAQPPRKVQAQAPVATPIPRLVLASELSHSSSLEGAARAGEAAAQALLSA